MDSNQNEKNENEHRWLSITEASKSTPYSAEYLSLLARRGKLPAKKIGNVWFTTKFAIDGYMRRQMLRANIQKGTFDANGDIKSEAELKYVQERLAQGLTEKIKEEQKPDTQSVLIQEMKKLSESLGGLSNKIGAMPPEKKGIISKEPGEMFGEILEEESKIPGGTRESFNKFLDSSIEDHFGMIHRAWQVIKRSFKAVISRPVFFFIFIILSIALVVFPTRFIFGFFDEALNYAVNKMKDAQTVLGFRPGTHENEILLLDKNGNISISGHVETEGQFRSFVKDGTAPIMVDSMTKVENLNADYLDGVQAEEFTLAYVTKNGNITTEDVYFEGKVEIGRLLLVKGATKLLSTLEVDGELNVFGEARFHRSLTVGGPSYFDSLLNAKDINASRSITGQSIVAKQSLSSEGNFNVKGQSIFGGFAFFNSGMQAKSGDFEISLGVGGDLSATGNVRLGKITKEASITSKNWNITVAGVADFTSLTSGAATIGGFVATTASTTNLSASAYFWSNGTTTIGDDVLDNFIINAGNWTLASSSATTTVAMTSGLNFDSGTFVIDPYSNFVGIGTTSPFATLSVEGNGYFSGDVSASNFTATGTIQFAGLGRNMILTTDNSGNIVASSTPTAAAYLATSTTATSTFAGGFSSASSFYVLQNGRVGIGTAAPVNTLNVNGSGAALQISTDLTDSNNKSGTILFGRSWSQIKADATGLSLGTYHTTLSRDLTIDYSGNVGIGTTTPYGKLAVNANFGETNRILFNVASSTATATTSVFLVNNIGYVGIGTSSPFRLLSVAGDAQFDGNVYGGRFEANSGNFFNTVGARFTKVSVDSGSWMTVGASAGSDDLGFFTNSLERMTIDNTGNVGIGSTTPGYKLSVAGSGYFDGGTITASGFTATSSISAPYFMATDAAATSTFAGGLAIETSGFVYDYSTNNVGIGTAAPEYPLSVNGREEIYYGSMQNISLTPTVTGAVVNIRDSGANSVITLDARGINPRLLITGVDNLSTSFAAKINGLTTTGLAVTNAGNVGIGTTTPQWPLTIYSATAPQLSLSAGAGIDQVVFRNVNSNLYIATSSNSTYASTTVPLMSVLSSGNVGIGTAAPGSTLDIGKLTNADEGGATIRFMRDYSGSGYGSAIWNGWNAGNGDVLYFGLKEGGNPATLAAVKMTILNTGNVGIGSTTPGYKLSVAGSGYFDGGTIIASGFTATSSISAPYFVANSASATSTFAGGLAIETSGFVYDYSTNRVGIGTAVPVALLSVGGKAVIGGILDTAANANDSLVIEKDGNFSDIRLFNTDTTNADIHALISVVRTGSNSFMGQAGPVMAIGTYSNTPVTLGSNAIEIMRLTGGNVGIGTTTPQWPLTIYSATTPQLSLSVGAGIDQWTIRNVNTNLYFSTSSNSTYATTTVPAMTILSSGNVGIGTAGPQNNLEISGGTSGAAATLLRLTSPYTTLNTEVDIDFQLTTQAGVAMGRIGAIRTNLPAAGDGALAFSSRTNGLLTEYMRIAGTGNVGIGTTSPGQLLEVSSASAPSIRIRNTNYSPTQLYYDLSVTDSGGMYIAYNGTKTAMFGVGGGVGIGAYGTGAYTPPANGMIISGNVGIGTTTPQTKLDVTTGVLGTHAISLDQGMAIGWRDSSNNLNGASIVGNSAVTGQLYLNSGGTGAIIFQTSNTLSSGNPSWGTGASEKMRITSTGNVGIGTSTPSNFFSVGGAAGTATGHGYFTGGLGIGIATTSSGTLQTSGNVYVGGALIVVGSMTSSITSGQIQFLANPIGTNIYEGGVYINPASAGENNVLLGIAVNGVEKTRIDAEGDIQIVGLFNSTKADGTNQLSGALSVLGNTTIGDNDADTATFNAKVNSSILPSANLSYDLGSNTFKWANLYVGTTTIENLVAGGTASSTFIINNDNTTADAEDSSLQFERGSETPNAILKWDSAGKQFNFNYPISTNGSVFGQGTASSTFAGPVWFTGSSWGTTLQDAVVYINPPAGPVNYSLFSIGVAGAERLRVDAEGDTTIQASLGIENQLYDITDDTLTINDKIQINGNEIKDSGGLARLTIGTTNTITGNLTTTGNFVAQGLGPHYFQSGNVGIGTTTPGSKLHIISDTAPQLKLGYDSLNYTDFSVGSDGALAITPTNSATTTIANGLVVNTNSLVVQDATGYVGIGTTNPGSLLQVSGDIRLGPTADNANVIIKYANGPQNFLSYTRSDNSYGAQLIANGNIGYYFSGGLGVGGYNPGQTNNLVVNGNVGIGTTTPSNLLSLSKINGDAGIQLTATSSAGDYYWTMGVDATDGKFKISSSTVLGTSDRFVIDGNGNVGIGTAAPNSPLHVTGTVGATHINVPDGYVSTGYGYKIQGAVIITAGSVGTYLSIGSVSWPSTVFTTGNVGIGTTTPTAKLNVYGGNVAFQTTSNSATAFQILNSATSSVFNVDTITGNVGIGSTTPGYKLSVAGGDVFINQNLTASNITATGTLSVSGVSTFTSASTTKLDISGTGAYLLANTASSTFTGLLNFTNASGTQLTTTGSTYLATAGGNVGIGTTTPQWPLTIYSATAPQLSLSAGAGIDQVVFRNVNSNLYIATSSNATYASTTIPLMTILSSGNVGIGTAVPSDKLHVTNNIRVSGGDNTLVNGVAKMSNYGFYVANDSGTLSTSPVGLGIAINRAAPAAAISNIGGAALIIENGNVGIGTTTPQWPLTIYSATTPQLSLSAGAGIDQWTIRNVNTNLYFSTSSNSTYATNTLAAMTILSSGNVGIGTTTPANTLDVNGSFAVRGAGSSVGGAGLFLGYGSSIATIISIDPGVVGKQLDISGYPIRFMNSNSNAEIMRISTLGNVGIGTTTPGFKLSVAGSGYFDGGTITASGFTATSSITAPYFVANSASATSTFAGGLVVDTNSLVVDYSSGYVGIGTTVPRQTLELAVPNSSSAIPVTSLVIGGQNQGRTSGGAGSEMVRNQILFSSWRDVAFNSVGAKIAAITYDRGAGLYTGQKTDLAFFYGPDYANGDNTVEGMRLTSTGNVGIGTTSPFAKLSVAGGNVFINQNLTASNITATGTLSVSGVSTFTSASTTKLDVSGTGAYFIANTASSTFSGLLNFSNASGTQLTTTGSTYLATVGGNVGIGTTTPVSILNVFGSSVDPVLTFSASTTAGTAGFYYGNWTIGADVNDQGKFKISSSTVLGTNDRFVIDGNGNVGIGTAAPGTLLDLGGGTVGSALPSTTKLFIKGTYISGTTDAVYGGLQVGSDNNRDYGSIFYNRRDSSAIMHTQIGTRVSGTDNVAIDITAGKVGIGSTTPGFKLSVAGSGYFDGGTITASGFTATSSITAPYFVANSASATSTFAGGLAIETSGFVYDYSSNNVGIGTAAPYGKLSIAVSNVQVFGGGQTTDLNSARNFEWGLRTIGDTASDSRGAIQFRTIVGTGGSDSEIGFWTNKYGVNRDERMTINNLGNVGIGTSTPQWPLTIYSATAPQLSLSAGAGIDQVVFRNVNSNLYIATTSNSTYATTTVPLMTILSTGAVGIGKANPTLAILDVNNPVGSGLRGLYVNSRDTANWGAEIYSDSQYGLKVSTGYNTGNNPILQADPYQRVGLRFVNAGNLGIGTSSPYGKLAVNANFEDTNRILFNVASSTDTATTSLFLINNIGYVGIGTSSPFRLLSVAGDAQFDNNVYGGRFEANSGNYFNTTGARFTKVLVDSGAWMTVGASVGSDDLGFFTNSLERMTIDNTGNVGIGSTTPGYKLSVAGSGYFDGGTITASGFNATSSISAPYFTATSASATSTFAGGFAVDTNGLVFDWQTNNVGIGTMGPSYALDVVQNNGGPAFRTIYDNSNEFLAFDGGSYNNYFRLFAKQASTNYSLIKFGNNSGTDNQSWSLKAGGSGTSNNFEIKSGVSSAISDNGTTVLTIQQSGNVGIGTTTPWGKLSISTNSSTSLNPLFIVSTSTLTSTTTALIVDSLGNIGVGTATPGAPLEILSTAQPQFKISYDGSNNGTITVNSSGNLFYKASGGLNYFNTASLNNRFLVYDYTDGSASYLDMWGNGITILKQGNAVISLQNTGDSYFNNIGNIGIGTTTPWAKFSVASRASDLFKPLFTVSTSTLIATTTAFIIDSSGNVGIGTTSPYAKLSVAGGDVFINQNLTASNITATGTLSVSGVATLAFASTTNLDVSGYLIANNASSTITNLRSVYSTLTFASSTGADFSSYLIANNASSTITNLRSAYAILNFASSTRGLDASNYLIANNASSTITNLRSPYATLTFASTTALDVSSYFIANNASSTITNLHSIFASSTALSASSYASTTNFFATYASTSQLTVNGSTYLAAASGNVGIATTTPQWPLTIYSATAPQLSLSAGAGIDQVVFRNVNSNLYIATTSNSTYATTTIPLLTILSNGNVGIGTTSPAYDLDIDKISSGPVVSRVKNGVAGTGNYAGFLAQSDVHNSWMIGLSSTFTTSGYNYASGTTFAGSGAGGISLGASNASGAIRFYTGGSADANERMRILSSGNVGIGTTSPPSKLSVDSTTHAKLQLNTSGAAGQLAGVKMVGSGNADWDIGTNSSASGAADDFFFYKNKGTAGFKMVINDAGNVGIGTTTPWGLLSVNPTSAIGANPQFVVGSSTATSFVINNAGNVGIGTTIPGYKLEVYDSTVTMNLKSTTGTNSARLRFENTGGIGKLTLENSVGNNQFTGSTAYALILGHQNAYPVQFATDNTVRMTILPTSGNVGIGTTTPDAKLQVNGANIPDAGGGTGISEPAGIIKAFTTDSQAVDIGGTIELGGNTVTTGSPLGFGYIGGRKENSLSGEWGGYLQFGTRQYGGAFTERMRITSGGLVGIGTTNPISRLQIATGTDVFGSSETPYASLGAAVPYAEASDDYNEGFRFTPNVNGRITQLGLNCDSGTRTVRLYSYPAGTLLANVDVTANGLGTWVYAAITPVNITTGSSYVVATRNTGGLNRCRVNPYTPPATVGNITINDNRVIAASDAMPDAINNNNLGLADITFQANLNVSLLVAGSVGIGTTTPGAKLDIVGALCVDDGSPTCGNAARASGYIYAVGTSITGIDLAEQYPTKDTALEAGDIVMLDRQNSVYVKRGENIFSPLGIVSTKPGVLLGGYGIEDFTNEKKVPVALSGRVPVKVNLEGGDIKIGDRIAVSSTTPGVGMKAATSSQQTIGTALEDFSGVVVTEPDGAKIYDRNAIGKILVFVNLGQYRLALEDEPIIKNHEQRITDSENKITNLETRVANLENIIASSSAQRLNLGEIATSSDIVISQAFSWILEQFKNIGITIADGIIQAKQFIADTITSREIATEYFKAKEQVVIGTKEKPIGMTIFERGTGNPICVYAEGGILKTAPGECGAEASVAGGGAGTADALTLPDAEVVPPPTTPSAEVVPPPAETPTPPVEIIPLEPVSPPAPAPEPAPAPAPEPTPSAEVVPPPESI